MKALDLVEILTNPQEYVVTGAWFKRKGNQINYLLMLEML